VRSRERSRPRPSEGRGREERRGAPTDDRRDDRRAPRREGPPTGDRGFRAPTGDRGFRGSRAAPWQPPTGERGPLRDEAAGEPIEPTPDLISDGEELVAGRRPVEEAFAARREARRLLVVPQRRAALEALVLHATRERIPIVEVEGGTLTSVAGFDGHQGIALVVAPRRWASLDDAIARALERGEPPFILALDSIEDPRNLGALLRSAEAAGVHGVVFPARRAAPLTAVAVKASAGASEHLALIVSEDLAGSLADLHARGLRVVGADASAALSYREADLRGPLAIVVGSEGRGFSAPTRRRLDLSVRIPMRGRVESLNASVAGSLLLFEASSQRQVGDGGSTTLA
jgi:23S rRNA (guanosine2251-2'-O)-methyltransferase